MFGLSMNKVTSSPEVWDACILLVKLLHVPEEYLKTIIILSEIKVSEKWVPVHTDSDGKYPKSTVQSLQQ